MIWRSSTNCNGNCINRSDSHCINPTSMRMVCGSLDGLHPYRA
uniref:Uncharacterized protein n=1 Tax=viral metagenome TaxID=1070528 RepID=A0A6C0BMM7_9ZZZZ